LYGDIAVATLITGFGRSKVRKLKEKIESTHIGLENIYRDTDSAFVIGIESPPKIDKDHPVVKKIVQECSASESEGGLGLPLEYQKCYSKVMIAASKNYMGLNADTGKIEVKGLVGKKRNQCKLIRETFEQQREYWKDDVSNYLAEAQIKAVVKLLDEKTAPLEKLQEKTTIGKDPITGYTDTPWRPECVLGRKYGKNKGESTPPYYLKEQKNEGDYYFTEDPNEISYNKYKERLKTALKPILTVRGYKESDINTLLGIQKNSINKEHKQENNNNKKRRQRKQQKKKSPE
jgi:DNA polymerase, archaea type